MYVVGIQVFILALVLCHAQRPTTLTNSKNNFDTSEQIATEGTSDSNHQNLLQLQAPKKADNKDLNYLNNDYNEDEDYEEDDYKEDDYKEEDDDEFSVPALAEDLPQSRELEYKNNTENSNTTENVHAIASDQTQKLEGNTSNDKNVEEYDEDDSKNYHNETTIAVPTERPHQSQDLESSDDYDDDYEDANEYEYDEETTPAPSIEVPHTHQLETNSSNAEIYENEERNNDEKLTTTSPDYPKPPQTSMTSGTQINTIETTIDVEQNSQDRSINHSVTDLWTVQETPAKVSNFTTDDEEDDSDDYDTFSESECEEEDCLNGVETELTTQTNKPLNSTNEFNINQTNSSDLPQKPNQSDIYFNETQNTFRGSSLNSSDESGVNFNEFKVTEIDLDYDKDPIQPLSSEVPNFAKESNDNQDNFDEYKGEKNNEENNFNYNKQEARRALFNIRPDIYSTIKPKDYLDSNYDKETEQTTFTENYEATPDDQNSQKVRSNISFERDLNYTYSTGYDYESTLDSDNYTTTVSIANEGYEPTPLALTTPASRDYNEKTLPRCPEGLNYRLIGNYQYCYTVTEPTQFPPPCPYPNNVLQHSVFHADLLSYNDITYITKQDVWVFAKRDTSDGFGRFKYLNVSSDVIFSYKPATKNITSANCMVFTNSGFQAVNCDEKHAGVCIYNRDFTSSDLYCRARFNNSCFGGDLNSANVCYCANFGANGYRNNYCKKLAEPKDPYQNFLLMRSELPREGCWIGLQKGANSSSQWSSSSTTATDYNYWSPDTNFTKIYGAVTNKGWTLTDNRSLSCAICEVDVEDHPKIGLKLKYNKTTSTVELHVFNGTEIYGGIVCVAGDFTTTVWLPQNLTQHERVNATLPDYITVSYYQCKALQISDFTTVYSNKISINTFGSTSGRQYFVRILSHEESDPYTTLSDAQACEELRNQNFELIKTVQPIKIENYSEESGQIEVICSLTTANAQLTIKEEYEQIFNSFKNISYESLLSNEVCLESNTTSGGKILYWAETGIGVTTTSEEICLQANGLPVTRTCLGNAIYGGFWSTVNGSCADLTISPRTTSLDGLLRSRNIPTNNLSRTLLNITQDDYNVTSFQVHLVSKVFERVATDAKPTEIENIVQTINNVMHFDRRPLRTAQTLLNATDELLFNLDESLVRAKEADRSFEIAVVTEKLLVQELNLADQNVRGIKVTKSNESRGFTKDSLGILQGFEEMPVGQQDLEAAVIIPRELQEDMKRCQGFLDLPSVIATVFYDDALFNEMENSSGRSDGKIVSLIAPEFNCDFNTPLKVIFKASSGDAQLKCASWTYGFDDLQENIHGRWSVESDPTIVQNSSYRLCEFRHITHFALLVLGETENTIDDAHKTALDVITAVGSGLSILGLLIIFLTAIAFKSFRTANGIVINFSIAMTAQIVLLFLADNVTQDKVWCTVFGAALHYIVLAQFAWMLIIAVLQYYRFVLIMKRLPSYVVLKSCAFCWGIPLIPVIVIVSISTDNYAQNSYGVCYALGNYFIFGILVPVCVIILVNLLIFLRILLSISASRRKIKAHQKNDDRGILQLRLAVLLYFLLGLTWGFGLLAAIGAGIVYSYLFCLTATLQGFILFLYFIVLNEKTRKLWTNLTWCGKKSPTFDSGSESVSVTMVRRRNNRVTNTSDATSDSAESRMLQKYKNRNSQDF